MRPQVCPQQFKNHSSESETAKEALDYEDAGHEFVQV